MSKHTDDDPMPCCVWVVDDDLGTREFLAAALGRFGYQVTVFSDGLELMQATGGKPAPSVIITDIHMPGKDGIETIFYLRQHLPDVPVIAISGGSNHGRNYLRLAEQCGVKRTLSKPFGADVVLAAVQSVLRRPPRRT